MYRGGQRDGLSLSAAVAMMAMQRESHGGFARGSAAMRTNHPSAAGPGSDCAAISDDATIAKLKVTSAKRKSRMNQVPDSRQLVLFRHIVNRPFIAQVH